MKLAPAVAMSVSAAAAMPWAASTPVAPPAAAGRAGEPDRHDAESSEAAVAGLSDVATVAAFRVPCAAACAGLGEVCVGLCAIGAWLDPLCDACAPATVAECVEASAGASALRDGACADASTVAVPQELVAHRGALDSPAARVGDERGRLLVMGEEGAMWEDSVGSCVNGWWLGSLSTCGSANSFLLPNRAGSGAERTCIGSD